MRVVYYARGGGHGHVMRGLAVLSRLRAGLLVAPSRLAGWARTLDVATLAVPDDDPHALVAGLARPELLLVDVFPRGVVADLLPVLGHMPAWLVSRRVRPEYYLDPAIREVIETRFERLIWTETPPEPLRALRVCQMELPPILLGPPMLARDEARRRLGMGGARPLLLGLGSGEAGPQARLARVLGKIAVRVGADLRFVSAELPAGDTVVDGFPAVSLLRAADAVVAASGYHAFHELTALGAPAVFVPQQRRFDDQVWRARDAETATDPPGLEAAVRRLLFRGWQAPRADGDGAARLARLVQRRVEAGVLTEEEIAAVA